MYFHHHGAELNSAMPTISEIAKPTRWVRAGTPTDPSVPRSTERDSRTTNTLATRCRCRGERDSADDVPFPGSARNAPVSERLALVGVLVRHEQMMVQAMVDVPIVLEPTEHDARSDPDPAGER